jgi:hypothetical protein
MVRIRSLTHRSVVVVVVVQVIVQILREIGFEMRCIVWCRESVIIQEVQPIRNPRSIGTSTGRHWLG